MWLWGRASCFILFALSWMVWAIKPVCITRKSRAVLDQRGGEWAHRLATLAAQSQGPEFIYQHPHAKPNVEHKHMAPALR